MNELAEPIFSKRPTITLDLPLHTNTRILHPDQVMLRIGRNYHDLGAYCYTLRSDRRQPGQPHEVVLDTFLNQRVGKIRQLIKALSRLVTDGGKRMATTHAYGLNFKLFLDWADACGRHDCLYGGDATRHAYLAWAEDTHERYRRQEFGDASCHQRLNYTRELLEASTGLDDLDSGVRQIKLSKPSHAGTEPLAPHDFAHSLALNHALFHGLCDLVLEKRPFPFKLVLPATLGWHENHLWVFPARTWRLPPHQWGAEREKRTINYWAYDYEAGCLATADEISFRYAAHFPSERRKIAKKFIAQAQARIDAANADARDRVRIMLSMIAHNAFLFLFFCNTTANEAVAQEIETDGKIDATALNQHFRSIKFRAGGKPIALEVPATFMPSLRRFMELRRYLLGAKGFPYLFFTMGFLNAKPPGQICPNSLYSLYKCVLRTIDPQLPRMGTRKLRASAADWYQRNHNASITAKVLQNSEETTQKRYDAGSATDHREEMSLFLTSVSESAKRQRVISIKAASDARPLDEGGHCDGFGNPEALSDHLPVKPNCKDSQGCLFCTHRVLVACEEDARKVASAAFVMEQVIFGPKHEEALRPLIAKCDEDLEKIAAFGKCRAMVEQIRKDVFENGNLTAFFSDKYLLFLELGVIA